MDRVNNAFKDNNGIEKSYQGDIHFKGDHSIGYLEQEPKLDSSKTVMDIVKEG